MTRSRLIAGRRGIAAVAVPAAVTLLAALAGCGTSSDNAAAPATASAPATKVTTQAEAATSAAKAPTAKSLTPCFAKFETIPTTPNSRAGKDPVSPSADYGADVPVLSGFEDAPNGVLLLNNVETKGIGIIQVFLYPDNAQAQSAYERARTAVTDMNKTAKAEASGSGGIPAVSGANISGTAVYVFETTVEDPSEIDDSGLANVQRCFEQAGLPPLNVNLEADAQVDGAKQLAACIEKNLPDGFSYRSVTAKTGQLRGEDASNVNGVSTAAVTLFASVNEARTAAKSKRAELDSDAAPDGAIKTYGRILVYFDDDPYGHIGPKAGFLRRCSGA